MHKKHFSVDSKSLYKDWKLFIACVWLILSILGSYFFLRSMYSYPLPGTFGAISGSFSYRDQLQNFVDGIRVDIVFLFFVLFFGSLPVFLVLEWKKLMNALIILEGLLAASGIIGTLVYFFSVVPEMGKIDPPGLALGGFLILLFSIAAFLLGTTTILFLLLLKNPANRRKILWIFFIGSAVAMTLPVFQYFHALYLLSTN